MYPVAHPDLSTAKSGSGSLIDETSGRVWAEP
jgi:hypothetical protein